MNLAMSCLKYLLFFFNLLVTLLGLAILVVGIWVSVDPQFLKVNVGVDIPALNAATYVTIAVGVLMLIVGFLGCCGTFQENKCMILSYIIIVTILLIIQIAAAALILKTINDSEIHAKVKAFLTKQLMKDKDKQNKDSEDFMDFLQAKLKCCGVSGHEDYKDRMIPRSCFDEHNAYNKKGCADAVRDFIKDKATPVGGITLGAFFIQLASVVVAVCLYCSIKQNMGAIV